MDKRLILRMLEYNAGAISSVTRNIEKKLVAVQEVRWEGNGTLESGMYSLFYVNHQLGTGFFS